MVLSIGIEAMSFYSSHYYLELAELAAQRGVPAERYTEGIGQYRMAVPPPGEDIVTMAANAADQALADIDRDTIRMVIFATESGIDQSKAAAIYVHHLLGLSPRCRNIEMKQACYSGTAGLQLARSYVAQHPQEKVLVLAADIARYGLGAAGEPTQGAGAVAMVISTDPKLAAIEAEAGYYCEDVMDFWRPNYRDEALVDGKASVLIYLRALEESWKHYAEVSGCSLDDFDAFCYHLPFSQMGIKAHKRLLKSNGIRADVGAVAAAVEPTLRYNREIGNSYAASLYIGLCALLDDNPDLAGKRIAMLSYGSGCMAEFFSVIATPGYHKHVKAELHDRMLEDREAVDYGTYARFYSFLLPTDGAAAEFDPYVTGKYRLTGMAGHKRIYARV